MVSFPFALMILALALLGLEALKKQNGTVSYGWLGLFVWLCPWLSGEDQKKIKEGRKMRRFCMVIFLAALLIPGLAMGANVIKTGTQLTVAWDPVTVPTGSTVQYQMYYRLDPSGGAQPAGNPITATQATVTFTSEGLFDVGVSSIRLVGGVMQQASSISWSNDPTVVQGGVTFVDQVYTAPANPVNMRVVPPPAQAPK